MTPRIDPSQELTTVEPRREHATPLRDNTGIEHHRKHAAHLLLAPLAVLAAIGIGSGCGSEDSDGDGGAGADGGTGGDGGTTPATCGEGLVTTACLCGTAEVSGGYCCDGIWQDEACSVEPTSCAEGPITTACLCGSTTAASGYCCDGQVQTEPCQTHPCTHYVKSAGDDGATGTSHATAWATVERVNQAWQSGAIGPGDVICFRRGDLFSGVTLAPATSGTADQPIVVASYDTGPKPVLSSFAALSSWVAEGGGVYAALVPAADAQTNMVTVDGVVVGMGRYPDAGATLTYESHSGATSITDVGIGDTVNWTGAELAINKNDWTLDRCPITNHSGDQFTFTSLGSGQEPEDGRFYFIQNALRCVTSPNEWFHDTADGRLYIFGDPSQKEVRVATLHYLVSIDRQDYITIDGLELAGAILDGIYSYGADSLAVQNCTLSHAGRGGIYVDGGAGIVLDHNVITQCHAVGIHAAATELTATNNHITNIGLTPGQSLLYHPNGIYLTASSTSSNLMQYNTIRYCGYNGIQLSSITNCDIKNNFITDVMQVLDDGGGIYLGGGAGFVRTIEGNIILDSGANAPADVSIARGIYIDSNASDCVVADNTVAGCREAGIQIHGGANNVVTGNTSYNNKFQIMFQRISSPIVGTVMNDNRFVAREASQVALLFYSSDAEIQGFGTSDHNYFARPMDDDDVFSLSSGHKTLIEWRALTGQDASSAGAPAAVSTEDELHFLYNETSTSTTHSLSAPMMDIDGATHSGTITLAPWSSIVLIGAGAID